MRYSPLTIPLEAGGWLAIDERDNHQMEIFRSGYYEPEVWEGLTRHMTTDEVLWDVGAFIGSVSVQALLDPRVKEVHAFEPNPEQANLLNHNLQLNGHRWVLHRLALSNRNESAQLFRHELPLKGGATLSNDYGAGSVTVNCHMVDTLVFELGVPAPTLMKVDIEDWEYPLFEGAARLFAQRAPKAIVFEASSDQAGNIIDQRLADYLKTYGYRIQWLKRYDGKVWHRENYVASRGGI
jgi:FkbM family methyltransferase